MVRAYSLTLAARRARAPAFARACLPVLWRKQEPMVRAAGGELGCCARVTFRPLPPSPLHG
jgi:hypothetical protein